MGDQLEEANDDLNDDTFGCGDQGSSNATQKQIGKDYDFFGQTAKATSVMNEEQLRLNRPNAKEPPSPPRPGSKSYKTGYESYRNPSNIPELQINANLWTSSSDKRSENIERGQQYQLKRDSGVASQIGSIGHPPRKMMSLEEVEAEMRSRSKKPSLSLLPQQQMQPQPSTEVPQPLHQPQQPFSGIHPLHQRQVPRERPSQHQYPLSQTSQAEMPTQTTPIHHVKATPQILQRGQPLPQPLTDLRKSPQPRQILQNPNRQPAQLAPRPPEPQLQAQPQSYAMPTGLVHGLPIITHPQQLMHLSEKERSALLLEDAKRAKRNHKIYLLSKDNGLMTPQDKNFITRIQLQQLMTATGNMNELEPDGLLSEDFYYQVYSQIKGSMRQNSHQPLSNFAQTYLFQTGSRQGGMARRNNRGGENHMQRMEQQVQRAVEAAKLKPKNKQLIIEGSLGKISFSNAKTPKPLLNLRKQETSDLTNRPASSSRQGGNRKVPPSGLSTNDRKTILQNVEAVYSTLMKMEDLELRSPSMPSDESDQSLVRQVIEWHQIMQESNQKLWADLKVLEPIVPESPVLHPFIAFLSYPKGKRAVPRIFRHIDQEQKLTILTIILVHLNVLDVIRLIQPQSTEAQRIPNERDEVELFYQNVMPSIFGHINEAPLHIVIGLLGIILDRTNMQTIARSKVGLDILTTLISRAEIVKQAEETNEPEWEQWLGLYNRLFDAVEPILGDIFPGDVNTSLDVYVWQFLAATGIGANPDQQQRLVIAVKYISKACIIVIQLTLSRDRVMETVQQSKILPLEMASQRLGKVNLFMRAIGLDVDLLG